MNSRRAYPTSSRSSSRAGSHGCFSISGRYVFHVSHFVKRLAWQLAPVDPNASYCTNRATTRRFHVCRHLFLCHYRDSTEARGGGGGCRTCEHVPVDAGCLDLRDQSRLSWHPVMVVVSRMVLQMNSPRSPKGYVDHCYR